LLAFTLFSGATKAQEALPKWELGLGVGAIAGPDYRGSKEVRSYVAPIPYFVYRGKFIRSDRDGLRGQFLERENLEFSLSMSANVTPESYKNPLRRELNLPELGSSLEIGPALNINLTGENLREGWLLNLPVRAVFTIGGDERGYTGYMVQPQLVYLRRLDSWGMSYRSSLSYASEDYHSYYYSIPAQLGTADFPTYRAKAGYSGWANQIALTREFDQWRLGFFVRHDYLGGTVFDDSPLVETKNSVRGGLALIWVMK
jgi:outer membrane scaffolding protein for murein synthesis (MipA/OmpV family)